MIQKKRRPADVAASAGPEVGKLATTAIDPTNTQPQALRQVQTSPAELRQPCLPDDRGESDDSFFRRRPGVNERVRLPFAGEVPLELIEQGGRRAFIHVFIIRNSDGSPGTRARAVFYSNGGTA